MKLELQEYNKFNKPSILCNISHNKDLSVVELKMYNFILLELFKSNPESIEDTFIYTSYSEISRYLGWENTKKVSQLKDNLKNLQQTIITFQNWDNQRNEWYSETTSTLLSSFTLYYADKKRRSKVSDKQLILEEFETEEVFRNGKLRIEVSKALLEYLLEYKDNGTFAKLDLIEAKSITSRHAFKLYEVFKDYAGQYNLKLTLKQLRELLNIPDEKYKAPSILNRNILNKSIKEIEDKTFLNVKYEYYRANKTTEAYYVFKMKDWLRYSFNRFKKTYIKLFSEVIYKEKNIEYILDYTDNNKSRQKIWLNAETNKTATTETAKKIWQHLHYKFNYETLKMLEIYDKADLEEFEETYKNFK